MPPPDMRPVMVFAYIGMAVTAPLWLPLYIAALVWDWLETRREAKKRAREHGEHSIR